MKFHENQRKSRRNLTKIELFSMSNFENAKKFDENLLKHWGLSGAKASKSCRSRQELSNKFLVFTSKHWRRYSRERASQSLLKISQQLENKLEKTEVLAAEACDDEDRCATEAAQANLPFSTEWLSDGAPAGCVRYNDGRVVYVQACAGLQINSEKYQTSTPNSREFEISK